MEAKAPCAQCHKCPLRGQAYLPTVFKPDANIIMVSENPDNAEIRNKKILPGENGRLMKRICAITNHNVEDVQFINAVACRSIGEPPIEAVVACKPRLDYELSQMPQQTVVALGKTAAIALDLDPKVSNRRGIWNRINGKDVIATWHPDYVLSKPQEAGLLINDISKAYGGPIYHEVSKAPKYRVIDTVEALQHEFSRMPKDVWISFDIESDGLRWWDTPKAKGDPILMLALCYDYSFGLIITDELLYDSDKARAMINEWAIERKGWLVAHNGKFDSVCLRNIGIELHCDFDTMLAHYALDETPKTHGLKYLAAQHFGVKNYEEELVKKYLKNKNDGYSNIPFNDLAQYAAWDVACTLALRAEFEAQLRACDMYEWPFMNLLMRASRTCTNIETNGMYVDAEHLTKWGVRMQEKLDELTAKMRKYCLRPTFNPNSSAQVAEVVYDQLGLHGSGSRRVGPRATSREALYHLKDDPFVSILFEYKRIAKLKSSYIDNLLGYISTEGKVHSTFKLMGTETGRLAVDKPATQTIPRPKDWTGKVIRGAFVCPPGKVLVIADFSQAELRVLADRSQEPFLLKVYREDRDLHDEGCNAMFGTVDVLGKELWEEQRVQVKMFNFAWTYGGNEYSFAEGNGLPIEEAKAFVRRYERNMPVAVQWKKDQYQRVLDYGFVDTIFGRRRRFPLVNMVNADEVRKAAVNAPIQATASDLNILAACELDEAGFEICLLVHDSIIAVVDEDEAEAAALEMQRVMREVGERYLGSIPWKTDTKIGTRWATPPEF